MPVTTFNTVNKPDILTNLSCLPKDISENVDAFLDNLDSELPVTDNNLTKCHSVGDQDAQLEITSGLNDKGSASLNNNLSLDNSDGIYYDSDHIILEVVSKFSPHGNEETIAETIDGSHSLEVMYNNESNPTENNCTNVEELSIDTKVQRMQTDSPDLESSEFIDGLFKSDLTVPKIPKIPPINVKSQSYEIVNDIIDSILAKIECISQTNDQKDCLNNNSPENITKDLNGTIKDVEVNKIIEKPSKIKTKIFKNCSRSKLSKRLQKIQKILLKRKMSWKKLLKIIMQFKSKKRRRINRVFGSKINRYSHRYVKEQIKRRYCKKPKHPAALPTEITDNSDYKSDNDAQKPQPGEPELQLNNDDDIRNKIKQQLQLLRLKKPTKDQTTPESKPVEPSTSKIKPKEIITKPVDQCATPDLSDVLLSNEGDHLIVSVVGGYISDEEIPKSIEEPVEEKEVVDTSQEIVLPRKKISIADILLKRSTAEAIKIEEENIAALHPIKLSKTTDITKIKGWRLKQFDASCVDEKNNEDKCSIAIPLPYSTVEPIASTSSYYPENVTSLIPEENEAFKIKQDPLQSFLEEETKDQIKIEEHLIVDEDIETERCKNSVFVSDKLDSFLNEHSTLKISYEVPKLKAEESISKLVSIMPVSQSGNVDSLVVKQVFQKTEVKFKPKTLAEKRKMMELDRQNELIHKMETNEGIYKKQLERNEKRNKLEINKNVRDNMINDNAPFSKNYWEMATRNDQNSHQFVIDNGRKIRIMGGTENKSVTIIKPTQIKRQSKLNHNRSVKKHPRYVNLYKPGPLCKKPQLLKTETDEWEYQILTMPKIKMLLYPKVGVPIAPTAEHYLRLCRDESGYIDDIWAQFSASALRTKAPHFTKPLEFDIPYSHCQNKVIVRKTRVVKRRPPPVKEPTANQSIRRVIGGILDYVANKDISATLIKDDPDVDYLAKKDEVCRPLSPSSVAEHTIIKRRNTKRNRTTLELRRLNVQVIEVDVQEEKDEAPKEDCNKDYCRLGCVCKSLQANNSSMADHCGRVQCMFECSCQLVSAQQRHHSVLLPAGTDLLSASTMVRLQDEAKRHLAKEEKKFTQTVIKANNQTIVVGGGARDRQRRVPKLPKKYNDFVNTTDELAAIQSNIQVESPKEINTPDEQTAMKKYVPIWNKSMKKKPVVKAQKICRVTLQRLENLENVIPLCMEHNLYKCYCGGTVADERPAVEKPKIADANDDMDEYISYSSRYSCKRYSSRQETSNINSQEQQEKYCARSRPLSNNYYQLRNKSQVFKQRYLELKKDQENFEVPLEERLNPGPIEIDPVQKDEELLIIDQKRTRKQKFVSLDESSDFIPGNKKVKMTKTSEKTTKKLLVIPKKERVIAPKKEPAKKTQQAKKGAKPKKVVLPKKEVEDAMDSINIGSTLIDYDKSYKGLLIPTETACKRFVELFSYDPSQYKTIRLIEWDLLSRRYKSNEIQLWFNSKRNSKNVILTENRRRPSRNHVNIKVFKNTTLENFKIPVIMTSLLTDTLPGEAKNAKETFLIMAYNSIDWEARGSISLGSTACKFKLITKDTPESLLTPKEVVSVEVIEEIDLSNVSDANEIDPLDISSSPEAPKKATTKLPEVVNTLSTYYKGVEITKIPVMSIPSTHYANDVVITKSTKDFMLSEYIDPPQITKLPVAIHNEVTITRTSDLNGDLSPIDTVTTLSVPLPIIPGLSRWYMLCLANDFSVLRISITNFHIKYTHLATAIQMARRNKKTVRIRSQDEDSPNISTFGVYAAPGQDNKIFFGPYEMNQEHGLEMYRYINGNLIDTKIYNDMRGNIEKKSYGDWFMHCGTSNNILSLELQSDNSPEKRNDVVKKKKPQIEFVDLTGNDSEEETEVVKKVEDPLVTVLKADLTKNKSTIYESKSGLVIRHVNNNEQPQSKSPERDHSKPEIIIRSTKRKNTEESPVKPKRRLPEPIECIDLDDDKSEPELSVSLEQSESNDSTKKGDDNKRKKIPELYPINTLKNSNDSKSAHLEELKSFVNSKQFYVIYIITNIPGVGYIDVLVADRKYYLAINSEQNNKLACFSDKDSTLQWVNILFRKYIYYVPTGLRVKFSLLTQNKDAPDMPRFSNTYLNGFHMMCRKGIYNLLEMTSADIMKLRFTEQESMAILSHKANLVAKKNTIVPNNVKSMDFTEKSLLQAPQAMKALEHKEETLVTEKKKLLEIQKRLIGKINSNLQNMSDQIKDITRSNVASILKNSSTPIVDIINEENTSKKNVDVKSVDGASQNGHKSAQIPYPVKLTKAITHPSPKNEITKPHLKFKILNNSVIVPINSLNKTVSVSGVSPSGTSILKKKSKLFNPPKP